METCFRISRQCDSGKVGLRQVQDSVNHPWFPKTERAARPLVLRALRKEPEGWRSTHDVRHYGQAQVRAVSFSA